MSTLTDPTVLETNRRGELTPEQIERLKQTGSIAAGIMVILLIAGGPVVLINLMGMYILPIPIGVIGVVVSIVCGFRLGYYVDRKNKERIQKELAAKEIRQAEGEVNFGWLSYRIQLPGRRVGLERDRDGLLPGVKYRFYYLPLTGLLLSAEPLSPPDETQVRESLLKILARANRFSLSTLNANRQGRWAASQILAWLLALWPTWLFLLMVGYLVFRAYQAQLAHYPEPSMRPALFTGPVVIITLFALLLLIGIMRFSRKTLADLYSGRVKTVEGIGKGVAVGKTRTRTDKEGNTRTSTTWTYYYSIKKQRIEVSARAYAALIDGLPYRLYYTPHHHHLLSIELLPASALKERRPKERASLHKAASEANAFSV